MYITNFQLNKPHAIIDSGTTNIMLPNDVYWNVLASAETFALKAANISTDESQVGQNSESM